MQVMRRFYNYQYPESVRYLCLITIRPLPHKYCPKTDDFRARAMAPPRVLYLSGSAWHKLQLHHPARIPFSIPVRPRTPIVRKRTQNSFNFDTMT